VGQKNEVLNKHKSSFYSLLVCVIFLFCLIIIVVVVVVVVVIIIIIIIIMCIVSRVAQGKNNKDELNEVS